MSSEERNPTESSPLLSQSSVKPNLSVKPAVSDEQDGTASVDSSPKSPLRRAIESSRANGGQKHYEGLPEVRKRMIYIFPAMAIGVFLAAADVTIIVSSSGRIGSDLDALSETSWIATGYFLTVTSFQPLYGKLSDMFGRKSCLLFAFVIFGLGCLFCGLAQDMNQLILARAFSGIGGGGIPTLINIILTDIIPLKDRGIWQGYMSILYSAGQGAGAPVGGLIADSIGWRWSFFIQVPLCVVAFAAVALGLKLPTKDENVHWRTKLRRVDFSGSTILILAVFGLLVGLDRGSNQSWRSKDCLIPLCLCFPVFGLFFYIESNVAPEPIAPSHVIFERSLLACLLCNFFQFAGWLGIWFYIPYHFQAVYGYNAAQAGLVLLGPILSGLAGSFASAYHMKWTDRYRNLAICSYGSIVIGMLLTLLLAGPVVDSTVGITIGLTIGSFAAGAGTTANIIALVSNATHEDQAVATACSYLFRSLGSTFGLALTSTALNQTLRSTLAHELGNGEQATKINEGVRKSLGYLDSLNPEIKKMVRACFAKSTRAAFGLDIALVSGAVVSACFIREKPLHD